MCIDFTCFLNYTFFTPMDDLLLNQFLFSTERGVLYEDRKNQ
jgi:hypothetical protein